MFTTTCQFYCLFLSITTFKFLLRSFTMILKMIKVREFRKFIILLHSPGWAKSTVICGLCHDFQLVDWRIFSDTDILVHIPLHDPEPLHQPCLAAAVVRLHLQAGLASVLLCWAHDHVLHGLYLGHHYHHHALLLLHAKQVEHSNL